MSALTDRQKVRERLSQVFQSILDKIVPADESVPLPGKKFVEWEDLADEVDRTPYCAETQLNSRSRQRRQALRVKTQ